MDFDNLKPLQVNISRAVVNGSIYDVVSLEEFAKATNIGNIAIKENYNGKDVVLPVRGQYTGTNTIPGVYQSGDSLLFHIFPNNENIEQFVPKKMIEINNTSSMKDIIESEDTLARLSEPWITSSDNVTHLPIQPDDNPEMKCLKQAINAKSVDFDKYSVRFGANFPNDKRQLKGKSATLNIIKRFCDKMDMEAVLILRDKNSNVPNPMGQEIEVSLTGSGYAEEDDDYEE